MSNIQDLFDFVIFNNKVIKNTKEKKIHSIQKYNKLQFQIKKH